VWSSHLCRNHYQLVVDRQTSRHRVHVILVDIKMNATRAMKLTIIIFSLIVSLLVWVVSARVATGTTSFMRICGSYKTRDKPMMVTLAAFLVFFISTWVMVDNQDLFLPNTGRRVGGGGYGGGGYDTPG
jgi:hypothetical protein